MDLGNLSGTTTFDQLRDAAIGHLDEAFTSFAEADEAHARALVLAVLALADAVRGGDR